MYYYYTIDMSMMLYLLDLLHLLLMLSYFIRLHFMLHHSLLVLRSSMSLLRSYSYHSPHYSHLLPLRSMLCLLALLVSPLYMSLLYYSSVPPFIHNFIYRKYIALFIIMHHFMLLLSSLSYSHLVFHSLLLRYLLLALRYSMSLSCLHNHFLIHSHLLPSNLLCILLVPLTSSSMSCSFMLSLMLLILHFMHNYFMNILRMLSFLLMYHFH